MNPRGDLGRRVGLPGASVVALLAGAGCATALPPAAEVAPALPAPAPPARTSEVRAPARPIVVADLANAPPPVAAVWKQYREKRLVLWNAAVHAVAPNQTIPFDDFRVEVDARSSLADEWALRRTAGAAPDPYLDQLAEVRSAGFIKEYVLTFFARKGWTIPAPDLVHLDMAGFRGWSRQHLDHHLPLALAEFASTRSSPGPGDDLPAARLPDAEGACSTPQSRTELSRALQAWDEQERRLAGQPVAFEPDSLDPALEMAARIPRARQEGVVLVAAQAAGVVFLAGFCALDLGANQEAEFLLRRAVSMSPANPNVRGELVQALIIMKRLDAADAELDVALPLAINPCHKAVLLRKRGFILFDRGKLVDAYAAYASSLEYEPGNALALKEMNTLVQQIQAVGGPDREAWRKRFDTAPGGTYTPPPHGKMSIKVCR